MARQLKLQKYELSNVNYQWLGAFRLRVEASDYGNSGADPNVFIYQRGLPNPYDGSVTDYWLGVAGPVDMSEYPVGEPDGRTTYPFYRTHAVEVDLRSTGLARETWLLVVAEVNQLLQALDRLDRLVPTEDVVVGDPAGPAGASASSAAVTG